jgi:glutamine amidotransferase
MSNVNRDSGSNPTVAIIDYKMGNLFSIAQACESMGIKAVITDQKQVITNADGIILPGVGAYGDAMDVLRSKDLIPVIKDVVQMGTPFLGICLGMQLLFSVSHEFGSYEGLGIIPGEVVRLQTDSTHYRPVKVPHVQWNKIEKCGTWETSLLSECPAGAFMYFVHSFYAEPEDKSVTVSMTRYGPNYFCSSVLHKNIFACQFHPEKSGTHGLGIYKAFANRLRQSARFL